MKLDKGLISLAVGLLLVVLSTWQIIGYEVPLAWDGPHTFLQFKAVVNPGGAIDFFPSTLKIYGGLNYLYQYPPLVFWVLAIIYKFLFWWSDIQLFWSLVIFSLPLIFFASVNFMIRKIHDSPHSMLVGSLLALPLTFNSVGMLGFGIEGLFIWGLVSSFISVTLFCIIVGFVFKFKRTGRSRDAFVVAFLSMVMALSHIVGSMATMGVLLYLILSEPPRKIKKVLLWGGAFSLPVISWLVFFWGNSHSIQAQAGRIISSSLSFFAFFFLHPEALNWVPISEMSSVWASSSLLLNFIFAALVIVGFIYCLRHKNTIAYFWALSVVIVFISSPVGDFIYLNSYHFHSYRLIAYTVIVGMAMTSYFLVYQAEKSEKSIFILFLISSILVFNLYVPFSKATSRSLGEFNGKTSDLRFYQELTKPFLESVIRFTSPLGNRVLADTNIEENWRSGSPHMSNYYLATQSPHEVMLGLFAESSPLHEYTINLLYLINDKTLNWAARRMFIDVEPQSDIPFALRSLGNMGIEYLIVTDDSANKDLVMYGGAESRLQLSMGNFGLFKILHPKPVVAKLAAPPIAFIDGGNRSIRRELTDVWFKHKDLSQIPLVFEDDLSESSFRNKEYSAYILYHGTIQGDKLQQICRVLREKNKPVIFFGLSIDGCVNDNASLFKVNKLNYSIATRVAEYIRSHKINFKETPVKYSVDYNNSTVSFSSHGPTIIRYAYYPEWKSSIGAIKKLSPALMYIDAQGETVMTLDY